MAEEIGFIYVDTGALYRSIGLHMLKKNIFPGDEQAVPRELEHVDIALEFKDGEQRVILCGEDVSDLIRTSEVSRRLLRYLLYLLSVNFYWNFRRIWPKPIM